MKITNTLKIFVAKDFALYICKYKYDKALLQQLAIKKCIFE